MSSIALLIALSFCGQAPPPPVQVFAPPKFPTPPIINYPVYKLNSDGSFTFTTNWPKTKPGEIVFMSVSVVKRYPQYVDATIPAEPDDHIFTFACGAGIVQAKPDGSATITCTTTGADFSDPTVTYFIELKTTVMYWNGTPYYTWWNTFDPFIVSY